VPSAARAARRLKTTRTAMNERARVSGGEGGIRTRQDSVDSVSYRFHVAAIAVDATVAVAPCTLLHARPRFDREQIVQRVSGIHL
jgi:hypothetical protein